LNLHRDDFLPQLNDRIKPAGLHREVLS